MLLGLFNAFRTGYCHLGVGAKEIEEQDWRDTDILFPRLPGPQEWLQGTQAQARGETPMIILECRMGSATSPSPDDEGSVRQEAR